MLDKYQNLLIIIFAMIVGFLSGILGAIILEDYFPSSVSYYRETGISAEEKAREGILIFKEREKAIKDLSINTLQKSIVGIARARGETTEVLESYYLPQDIIAYGFVLTDDGWIVTLAENLEKEISGELVVVNDNNTFSFKEKVIDPSTGVLFMKVETNGKRLIPLKLGNSDKLKVLDELVGVDLFNNIAKHTTISVDNFDSLIQSSEVLGRRMVVGGGGNYGSPIINSHAEVIGIIDEVNEGIAKVIPVNYFKDTIDQVLKSGSLERIFLGTNYIDLSKFPQSGKVVNGIDRDRGALIYAPQIIDAIKAKSPARLAGLKYKDIIISIEGEDLGVNKNLSEIIQEYKVGSEVEIKVLRGKREMNIPVKLTNIK